MKSDEENLIRLSELILEGEEILKSVEIKESTQGGRTNFATQRYNPPRTKYYKLINKDLAFKWRNNCLHFLEFVFGNGNHLQSFSEVTKMLSFDTVRTGIVVLTSAKEIFEKGYNQKFENKIIENKDGEKMDLATICDEEAKRNARIYLIGILFIVLLLSFSLYNFGIIISTITTIGLLFLSYLSSALFLKEWTPSKLHERILELEKERIYRRFGINLEKK